MDPFFECPLRRDEAERTLMRALEILRKEPSATRGRNFTKEAKYILRGMTCDMNIGSTSEDSQSPVKVRRKPEYCEVEVAANEKPKILKSTKKKILHLHDFKNYTTKGIQAQYPWYRSSHLQRSRESCRNNETSNQTRIEQINTYVLGRAEEAMRLQQPLHDYMLVRWAVQRAGELNARSFFVASHTWLLNSKKRNDVVSRKITHHVTQASAANQNEIDASARTFHEQCISRAFRYPPRLILNVDQTGSNYALHRERTLARKGSRDVSIIVESVNKRTHPYTAQPMISRDGRLFGKLLLCLQEVTGRFGLRTEPVVRDLERRYGNIEVVASESGKMSKELLGT